MYHIIINFADQSYREFYSINKIEYSTPDGYQTVSEREILSHRFPLRGTYFFYGNDIFASVDANQAKTLEITTEH